MSSSTAPMETAAARNVRVTDAALVVELQDGRVVSVPLAWYPRLMEGSAAERKRWELIGPGVGIHWPALDEDISVDGLLRGLPSGESAASLERWRASRSRLPNPRVQPSKAQRRPTTKRAPRTGPRG